MKVNKGGTGRLRWAQPQELQLPKRDLELVQSRIHLYWARKEELHQNCPQGELENVLKAKLIYCLKSNYKLANFCLKNDYKMTPKMTNWNEALSPLIYTNWGPQQSS